mmetsp:Transcript_120448/g.375072  ORF Transcript_120448/g.375072 Transcript_120448/m.375072 type:complete len:358 (-) Transcript_120448:24-1097(-)
MGPTRAAASSWAVAVLAVALAPCASAVRLQRAWSLQDPQDDLSSGVGKSSKGKGSKIRFKLLDNLTRGSCLPYNYSWEQVRCKDFGWKKSTQRRRVFDAFAYNGETDVVEARRRELAQVVDGTAVAITTLNFKGQRRDIPSPPKGDNIRHWVLPPESFSSCWNENQTMDRECACSMTKNSVADVVDMFSPDPEDWVVFGDPDEIPNREALRLLSQCDIPVGPGHSREVIHMSMSHHYYFDLRCESSSSKWEYLNHKTPAAVKVATMREYGLRVLQAARAPACVRVGTYSSCSTHLRHRSAFLPCAAWHLSSFGGVERLANKSRDNADLGGHVHLDQFSVPHSVEEDPARFQVFFNAQ